MCGIAGLIKLSSFSTDTYLPRVKEMANAIKHRGPDSAGFWSDQRVGLGFGRLSIIDLSAAGNQPMFNEDRTVVIVFNGEIYNFQSLRNDLEKNHQFSSHTDTEVLIHGYQEWGLLGLLERIEGMFAFCLYDTKKEEAYLVRDRVGKKPLYYFSTNHYLAFASEIKSFFALDEFNFSIDQQAFDLWMGFPYLPDNELTLIRGVKKVPPAHFVTVSKEGGLSTRRYWSISSGRFKGSYQEAVREIERLLMASIKRRLVADVPVGILLSGGLDSSLIAALAKKSGSDVRAINISFPGSSIDESPFAQQAADYCGLELIKLRLECSDIYQDFKESIWIFDDLSTYDSGLFSTYLMSQKVRSLGVKVLLTGEGADEVLGGYTWFGLSQYPFRILPRWAKSLLYYYAIMRVVNRPKFLKYAWWLDSRLREQPGPFFEKLQRYEIKYSLPNHYCMKLDKGSSAASVEARTPYLDYQLVDFLCRLPTEYKLAGRLMSFSEPNEKRPLRAIAQKYLPREIYSRKKKGGMLPVYKVLEEGVGRERERILNSQHLVDFFGQGSLVSLLKPQSIKLLVWQREWLVWKCLVFSLWHDYYSQYA